MIPKEFETISEYVCKQTRWTDGSIRHDRMEDVVRCKDCIVFGTHGKNTDICPMWHNTHIDPYRDFCSRGVRKTEPSNSEIPNNCEPQTIRCPKCGRTDYIRDMEKDMGIEDSGYKYKCINCNTYIKDEPQTQLTARCLNCNNAKVCKENNWQGCRFEPIEDEPQTICKECVNYPCESWQKGIITDKHNLVECRSFEPKDEPQTDCAWK